MKTDYYETLNVKRSATDDEISTAYCVITFNKIDLRSLP